MKERLKRLDGDSAVRDKLLSYCRLKAGEIWEDPLRGHRVGVLDASDPDDVSRIIDEKCKLIMNDPPYNVVVGNSSTQALSKVDIATYIEFSRRWVNAAVNCLDDDAHFYVWMGADYKDNFQPLPDFMILMREFEEVRPRNFITLRNQRGYGTQRNWMWVRQELLHYVKGSPEFNVSAEYTDIPKILRGYYKEVNGKLMENQQRSKSENIRAGNVWVDVQQVFYRMEENVPGCYAQKPLKAVERIILASTDENQVVADFFSHSGATLLAGERHKRKVFTFDRDPVFAELTIRRVENYRKTGRLGWQWASPFPEIDQ